LEGGDTVNLTKRGIISIALILFAFVTGLTTLTGFSLGDKILLMLGIPAWSNGQTGSHYTIILTIILLAAGVFVAKKEMTGRRLIALIALCILISPWIASLTKSLYYKTQKGLATVEYDFINSHFNLRDSEDSKNLEVAGLIIVTNYGRNPVKVGIKISSNNLLQHNWFSEDVVLTETKNDEELLTLSPGEKRSIWAYSTVPIQNTSYRGHGWLDGLNLTLYNDEETRKVGRHL
jgi:hypothetical protein